ncbi:N-acetylmannosamine-6-phosphate 2-epimerase [Bacillus infantis]|uniref:N-acetylmannosamine-6-phosphate 2-epimerase n=1 Tax=Bacillus infantis TaxID=324767 RepID=UPI003CF0ADC4
MDSLLENLKGGLIVSCQALEHEPLYGSSMMGKMALAAAEGGAAAIRANTAPDIIEIKKMVELPVVGLVKRNYVDSEIYITPTLREVHEGVEAGADIIAFDATGRIRPEGQVLTDFIKEIRQCYPCHLLMADIATLEEGILAARLGVDLISTTLCGYTPYTAHIGTFCKHLLAELLQKTHVPIIAEGRISTPSLASECIKIGAHAVVVGSAITRPQEITRSFVREMNS